MHIGAGRHVFLKVSVLEPRQTGPGRQSGSHLIVRKIHIKQIKQYRRRNVKIVNCMFQMSTWTGRQCTIAERHKTSRQDHLHVSASRPCVLLTCTTDSGSSQEIPISEAEISRSIIAKTQKSLYLTLLFVCFL